MPEFPNLKTDPPGVRMMDAMARAAALAMDPASPVTPAYVPVLAVLANRDAQIDKAAFPSHADIQHYTGHNERTIRRAIDALEAAGLITVQRSEGRVNLYRVHDHLPVPARPKPTDDRAQRHLMLPIIGGLEASTLDTESGVPRTESPGTPDRESGVPRTESPPNRKGTGKENRKHEHGRAPARASASVASLSISIQERDEAREAVAAWNRMASENGLAEVQHFTSRRRDVLAARLRECGGLDGWQACMEQVAASDFLKGGGARGWRADFGWLIQSPEHFARVMEGGYTRANPLNPVLAALRDTIDRADTSPPRPMPERMERPAAPPPAPPPERTRAVVEAELAGWRERLVETQASGSKLTGTLVRACKTAIAKCEEELAAFREAA